MKTLLSPHPPLSRPALFLALALAWPLLAVGAGQQSFPSPEAAANRLITAILNQDTNAFRELFGPEYQGLVNPDRVQAADEFTDVAAAITAGTRIVREAPTRAVVEIGADHWPFPVPIVEQGGQWVFDTAAGKDEVLNRRIGRNELAVLQSMRAFVQAQREYASQDRDGDQVLEFAQNLISSPGLKDGLYWPPALDGSLSPLGPLIAEAQVEGYRVRGQGRSESVQPFHGYYFRILTRQGRSAPGGAYDYIINGNMIGGFALVAWPAEYGNSGIMTFIVNQQGRVFQRDLGRNTSSIAARMTAYEPGTGWMLSPD